MELGLIGLGKMGGNMARRWMGGGHTVVGYARTAATVQSYVKEGMIGAGSVEDLVKRLKPAFATLAPGPDHGWGRVGRSARGTSSRWSTTASSTG
jgi:6-phosphogluconate dehydrogenase (decarboxylating)